MSLNFQPIADIQRGRPIAFEAVARWHHAEPGVVPPNVFIAVAERTELVNQLTQVLLGKALAAAAAWPEHIQLSFNLPVRDIMSEESTARIVEIVKANGVDPKRIGFKVTESAVMGESEQAHESIEVLRALGATVSLDDFGTGYSSLSYVHRLPLDTIKIDRSFVTGIEARAKSRDIVQIVVDLCRNLEINCVVEGMETQPQADILKTLGCRRMQGYLFAKPLAPDDVLSFIADSERRSNPDSRSKVLPMVEPRAAGAYMTR